MEIKILQSALKHGISEEGILHCLNKYRDYDMLLEELNGEKAQKRMVAGFDNNGNPIEVGFIENGDNITVIHAMKLQSKYQHLLEGVNYGI